MDNLPPLRSLGQVTAPHQRGTAGPDATGPGPARTFLEAAWPAAAMAVVVYLSARAAYGFHLPGTNVGAFWPPAGLSLGLLLLWGLRAWPGIAVGSAAIIFPGLLEQHATGAALITGIGEVLADVVPAVLGAWTVRRVLRGADPLARAADLARLLVLAGPVTQALGATMGVAAIWAGGMLRGPALWDIWFGWWVSNIASVAILVPACLAWRRPWPMERPGLHAFVLATALACGLMIALWLDPATHGSLKYAGILVVIWAAFALGARGATGAALLVGGAALWGIVSGRTGALPGTTPEEQAVLLGFYLTTLAVTGESVAAVLAERASAAARLAEARTLLTALVDSTRDLIWSVDARRFALLSTNRSLRDIIGTSRGLELQVGMEPEEVLGNSELAEQWRGFYRRALAEGPYSLDFQAPVGGLVLELHFNLLEHEGEITGIAVFGRDISEQWRAREQLRRSESFFRALQETSPDVAAVVGPDQRLSFVSAACVGVLGYSIEELRGTALQDAIHPADLPMVLRDLEHLMTASEGTVLRRRYRVRHRDGSWRFLEAVARNETRNPDVGGVLANARDVTEQVQLAARLQRVREEEKTRIARDLHDELGQLLTGLKMDLLWLEGRIEAMPPSVEVNALLERAVAAAELSDRTVVRVQQLASDLRPAALDRLGLGAALRQEARQFEERTSICCHVAVPEELPPHAGDTATALYRISQEALTNVARHARASNVNLRLEAVGSALILSIEDDGIGFDLGESSRPRSLGLLGMAERAELLGGGVAFAHRAPRGTVVTARVPVSGREEPQP